MKNNESIGTLDENEIHPAAHSAMKFVKDYLIKDLANAFILKEALASLSISGDRIAQVCSETLDRIMRGESVSDRYLLGLAWTIREFDNEKHKE